MSVTITCPCPPTADGGTRHPDGDTITFRPTLGFRESLAIRTDVRLLQHNDDDASVGEVLAVMTEGYILHGVSGWTLVDEKGKPRDLTRAAIREHLLTLEDPTTLADYADGLYSEKVMLPLLRAASSSSQPSPTGSSTSPTTGSSQKRPTPSRRSSTATTPTDDTATTSLSLVGASS